MEQKDNIETEQKVEEALEDVNRAITTIKADTQMLSKKSNDPLYFPHKPVGSPSAILSTVFGSLLTLGFGITVFIFSLVGISGPLFVGMFIPFLIGLLLDANALNLFKRLKRYKRYLSLFKGKNFCFVEDLAEYSGYSNRFVLNDMQKMINKGFYPQANISKDQSLILLNINSFDKYMSELRKHRLELEKESIRESDMMAISENNEVVSVGREFIKLLESTNEKIEDKEVSDKVFHLETIINQIVTHVENHLEQLGNVRRLFQFYLPLTIKVLTAYSEFEKHTIQGENITTTKNEIKNSLDTINQAFEKLLNNLFANISMDISTDLSVLHTMLNDEGLTKKDFDIKDK